ncbi:MAG: DUF2975 domain-containing protein [Pyrinomonadaceae bacterium]
MKKVSTIFLQVVITLLGLGVLTFLIVEPQLEGRNAHATSQVDIYLKDPFLLYIYLAFVPFFVGLFQGIKLLGYARRDEVFSLGAVRAMRTIKYCGIAVAVFIVGAELYIFAFVRGTDDIAGGVMMGAFIIAVSTIVAMAAAVFERILQNGTDIKSENDLTV